MRGKKSCCLGVLYLVVSVLTVRAQEAGSSSALEEELRYLQAENYVITATRTKEDIEKCGASVTVITEDQIRKMGARDLFDILQIVPGIGITQNSIGQGEIEARGIKTTFSEKVLVLVDGHSINNQLVNGGFQTGFGGLVVENMKRVEVVRGPGSALYGANAFLAVVNVITKEAEDAEGLTVTLHGGAYDTAGANVLYGKTGPYGDAVVNYNYYDTDGLRAEFERDAIGASGRTTAYKTKHDLDIKLGSDGYRLHARFAGNEHGPFVGLGDVLSDETEFDFTDFFLDVSKTYKVNDRLSIAPRVYYDHLKWENFFELYPEGFDGFGVGLYPDGVLILSGITCSKFGGEVVANYTINETNKAVFGVSYEENKQFDVVDERNYDGTTGQPLPGGYQDVSDDPSQVWASDQDRSILAFFVEDIWDIREDLRLVLGARYDNYDDFGGTLNPRASAIWEFADGYNLRILYGSAFREPTFAELYNQNNPMIVGNPGLEPEEIDTYEIAVSGQFTDNLRGRLTGFRNEIDNLIAQGVPNVNTGEATVTGGELEFSYSFRPGSYFAVNYTLQDAEEKVTGERVPDTPKQRANLMLNVGLPYDWDLWTHVQLKGSTIRAVGDGRDDVDSYGTVNVALTTPTLLGCEGLSFSVGVWNLFDKDCVDPSSPSLGVAKSDYPRPGRTAFVRMGYTF